MKHAVFGLILLCATPIVSAGDRVAGERLAREKECFSCHATDLTPKEKDTQKKNLDWEKPSAPENPKLGGQHKDYLVQALLAYKQGDRSIMGRKNVIMASSAEKLSAQQIQDLAEFFGSMKGSLGIKR